jgi:sugar phosphate isomerase/epimerase
MRLSIVSDEASFDLESALEVMQECHCKEYVLRHLGLDLAPMVDERWVGIAEKALQLRRFRITAIEADIFGAVSDVPQETADIFVGGYTAGLFLLARRLQCNTIVVVPPAGEIPKEGESEPNWRRMLRTLCSSAAQSNLSVLYKTEKQNLETALHHILAVGAPNLGLDWDVAGSFGAGDDSGLSGVEDALKHLKCVRVRDAVRKGRAAEWAALEKGVIPWEDILELLFAGGYRGPVVLEPKLAPKLKEARAGLTLLGRWIDACRIRRRPGQEEDDEADRPEAHEPQRGDRHARSGRHGPEHKSRPGKSERH